MGMELVAADRGRPGGRRRREAGGAFPTLLCPWGVFLGALGVLLWGTECSAYPYSSYGYGGGDGGGKATDLNQVKALTLRRGELTAGRRLPGVPQLQCVGGCEYEPDVVQCLNVGTDGRSVQWQCKAELPSHLVFGKTDVICEGYLSAEDDRVLEGSCGLTYTLKRLPGAGGKYNSHQQPYERSKKKSWNFGKLIGFAVFIYFGVRIWQLWTKARQHRSDEYQPSEPPYPGPGSWGGGPWGSNFAAPPPPYGYPNPQGSVPPPPGHSASGSGVSWSSAVSGFGLGYLFGRSGHGNQSNSQAGRRRPWNSTESLDASERRREEERIAGERRREEEERRQQERQDSFHTSTAYASTSKR